MIGVISSTLVPSVQPSHDGARSNLDPALRLQQTVETVESLVRLELREIYLADNSAVPPDSETVRRLTPATVIHFGHFPYKNKGIGELILLLDLCSRLPDDQPIMKISGRYRGKINLCAKLASADFVGRFNTSSRGPRDVSTRGYATRNRRIFSAFVQGTLDTVYASPWKIAGPRSFWNVARNLWTGGPAHYPFSDPPVGVEIAAAAWLRRSGLSIQPVHDLGIDGTLGSWINPSVSE